MHVANLIDPNTSGLQSPAYGGIGYWTATNATLARTTKRAHSGIASIEITATATTSNIYSGDSTKIAELVAVDRDKPYRLFLWFHHETVGREIRVGVQFYDVSQQPITQTAAHYEDFEMSFREWTLASLVIAIDDIPLNATYAAARIKFEVPDINDKIDSKLWIDDVVFYHPENVKEEPIIKRLSRWIPEYMIEADDQQTNPVNPMLLYLDAGSATLGEVYEYISDFGYETVGDPNLPTATSTLVDPSGYPANNTQTEWLPWLAQLVGLRSNLITDTSSGTTWASLEAYSDWDAWESVINGDTTYYSMPWTSVSRTNGITTVNVSSHSFSIGDVFEISGASGGATTALDGIYEVATVPSGTSITFSQIYTILSLSQVTTTVTVTTGVAHNLSVGSTVEIDGTFTTFDGTTQTVVTVSQSVDSDVNDIFTFTSGTSGSQSSSSGNVFPTDLASGQTGTIATTVDLDWASVEGENAYPLTPPAALAEFIRTGASGIWAGTIEGMKRASRLSLEGIDGTATIERSDGFLKVTMEVQHQLATSDFVEIYACPYAELNGVYQVSSIVDNNSFKVVFEGSYLLTRGWATSKRVEIQKQYWNGTIQSISSASDVVTVTFQQMVPVLDDYEITGNIAIADTGNGTLDDDFGPFVSGDVSISADRRSISFDTGSTGTISLISPTGAHAKLFIGDNSCYLIKTLSSQTAGPEAVLNFANFAKPAGSALTHEYI